MIVGFIANYAISAYRYECCEFESRSGEVYSIQHYVIKFVSDLRQVCGFLWLLRFPPPKYWPSQYYWNTDESGVKHHKPKPTLIKIYRKLYEINKIHKGLILIACHLIHVFNINTGPINNILLNGKEITRSLSCSVELSANHTRTKWELKMKPLENVMDEFQVSLLIIYATSGTATAYSSRFLVGFVFLDL